MDYRMVFTEEEWNQLLKSSEMTAFYISHASPSGMVGILKEMMASTNQIVAAIRKSSGNSLVDELAADIKLRVDQGVKIESPILVSGTENMKEQCLQYFRDLSALLSAKAPVDAEGFKKWLYDVAQKTAEAAKEGGFLGIGGEKVNEAELAALKDLALALGLSV
jgi:hypothetical protein